MVLIFDFEAKRLVGWCSVWVWSFIFFFREFINCLNYEIWHDKPLGPNFREHKVQMILFCLYLGSQRSYWYVGMALPLVVWLVSLAKGLHRAPWLFFHLVKMQWEFGGLYQRFLTRTWPCSCPGHRFLATRINVFCSYTVGTKMDS
jgi:hypothetical protein